MDLPIVVVETNEENIGGLSITSTTNNNKKRIDFTSKFKMDENILLCLFGNSFLVGDVFWWGLCLVTFTCDFIPTFRSKFLSTLKESGIICTIIDNHSGREFLMLFNSDSNLTLFNNPITLRKGIQPCISSVAESLSNNFEWYHLSGITDEHRISIATIYKTVHDLFPDNIHSIEIVRDLYNKEYILI